MTRNPNESMAQFANRVYTEAARCGMPGAVILAALQNVERETAQTIAQMCSRAVPGLAYEIRQTFNLEDK